MQRLDLLQRNRMTAKAIYRKSIAAGVPLPVVVVVDTADPAGRAVMTDEPLAHTSTQSRPRRRRRLGARRLRALLPNHRAGPRAASQ
jgi:hypothetical protein